MKTKDPLRTKAQALAALFVSAEESYKESARMFVRVPCRATVELLKKSARAYVAAETQDRGRS